MNQEALLPNILTIAGGVLVSAVLFGVLTFVLGRLIVVLGRRSSSPRVREGAETLRSKVSKLLLVAAVVAGLAVVTYGIVLMFQGQVLHEFLLSHIETVPSDAWIALALGFGKVVALVIATFYVLRLLRRPLEKLADWTRRQAGLEPNRKIVDDAVEGLGRIIRTGAWLAVVWVSLLVLGVPSAATVIARMILMIYLIGSIGQLLRRLLALGVNSLDGLVKKYASPDNWLRFYDRLTNLMPLLKRTLEYVLIVTMATLVVMQVQAIAPMAQWGSTFITIIGILFLSRVAVAVVKVVLYEAMVVRAGPDPELKKRRATVTPLIANVIATVIYFIGGVACLDEIGFDPVPLLAGAGILGLVIGLGAQGIVNDVLSGFFLLFEGYFLVGDYVEAGGVTGFVDKLNLRTTRIRGTDGRMHLVPNGEIRHVSNSSQGFVNAVVDVGVDYESNLDDVTRAVMAACKALRERSDDLLEDTVVQGIESFGGSEIVVRTVTKVRPGRHLLVERALRVELKRAFEAAGVEIPFAHRVVIFKDPDAGRSGRPGPHTTE